MVYALKEFTLESLKKVIEDLKERKKFQEAISFTLRDEDNRPKNWVIDIERNHYLVELPLYRKYRDARRMCLFLDGRVYVLVRYLSISNEFCFEKGNAPGKKDFESVELEALNAFKIYGEYGTGNIGPFNESIEEFNAVIVNKEVE